MRLRLFGLLLIALVPAGYVQGQDYGGWGGPAGQPFSPPIGASAEFGDPDPPARTQPEDGPGEERVWFKSEYLLWFVRNDGPHMTLVTTDSNPGTAVAGSFASPTVVPLFGSNGFDYGALSGGRFTVGGWLDAGQRFGLEASGFLLEKRSDSYAAASNMSGQPPLYVPAFNVLLQREDSLVVADPVLKLAGNVTATSSIRLWGTELNGLYRVVKSENWQIDLQGGFRYLNLGESFALQNTTTDLTTGTYTSLADLFQTGNQFYGAQFGVRVHSVWGRFLADISFQTALGATRQSVTVTGSSLTPTGLSAGGFFAEPSNIGRQVHDAFTAVPQLSGMLGYRITSNLSALVGYDLLDWTDVVRAGNQVDRNLNLSQNAALGTTGGTLVGPARPAPLFSRSDFTAGGVTFALLWQY